MRRSGRDPRESTRQRGVVHTRRSRRRGSDRGSTERAARKRHAQVIWSRSGVGERARVARSRGSHRAALSLASTRIVTSRCAVLSSLSLFPFTNSRFGDVRARTDELPASESTTDRLTDQRKDGRTDERSLVGEEALLLGHTRRTLPSHESRRGHTGDTRRAHASRSCGEHASRGNSGWRRGGIRGERVCPTVIACAEWRRGLRGLSARRPFHPRAADGTA